MSNMIQTPISLLLLLLQSILIITRSNPRQCTDREECSYGQYTKTEYICSGQSSCKWSSITATDDSIQCSGQCACTLATKLKAATTIYCSSFEACEEAMTITANAIQCSGYAGCRASPWKVTKLIADKGIYCGGENSCRGSNIHSTPFLGCHGSFSCATTTINSDEVECNGDYSCWNSIIFTSGNLLCSGNYGCSESLITAQVGIQFYGANSGQRAVITNTPLIEVYGDTVLRNSVIDSGSLMAMTVKLYGDNTVRTNAPNLVICRSGASCDISCKGTGCSGLEVDCESGAVCTIDPVKCNVNSGASVKGIDCPLLTSYANKIESKSIAIREDNEGYDGEYDLDEDIRIHHKECYKKYECAGEHIQWVARTGYAVVCGGLESCYNATINHTQQEGYASCMGVGACSLAKIKAPNIRCDAESGCKDARHLYSGYGNKGGEFVCYGSESCMNVELIEHLSMENDLQCGASNACKKANILTYHKGIVCSGNKACCSAEMSIETDVHCNGFWGCADSKITSNSGDIINCDGSYGCKGAIIWADNYGMTLDVGGYLGATMGGIKGDGLTIIGRGYQALSYSVIDSEGASDMTVDLYGHQSGYGAAFMCRSGSECTLICRGSACHQMSYFCEDGVICNIEPSVCDTRSVYQGINCPNFHNGLLDEEMNKLLEGNLKEREHDEVYQKIKISMEQWEDLEYLEDHLDDLEDNEQDEEQILFFGGMEIKRVLIDNGELLLGIAGICLLFVLFYLRNKMKFNEYQILK